MTWKKSHFYFSASRVSVLGTLWNNLRFYWYTHSQMPWLAALVVCGLASGGVFLLNTISAWDAQRREVTCLALNIYYEARGEPLSGQQAVAEVTMNRVASPRFPNTVCEVVYEKRWDRLRKRYVGAFSWTEFDVRPHPGGAPWKQALEISEAVYFGKQASEVGAHCTITPHTFARVGPKDGSQSPASATTFSTNN